MEGKGSRILHYVGESRCARTITTGIAVGAFLDTLQASYGACMPSTTGIISKMRTENTQ